MDGYCAYEGLRSSITFIYRVVWRVKELTGVLVLFCERVKLFLSLLFLNLLNAAASVSVHLVISVLLCLHLTEEITISVNSETEMLL